MAVAGLAWTERPGRPRRSWDDLHTPFLRGSVFGVAGGQFRMSLDNPAAVGTPPSRIVPGRGQGHPRRGHGGPRRASLLPSSGDDIPGGRLVGQLVAARDSRQMPRCDGLTPRQFGACRARCDVRFAAGCRGRNPSRPGMPALAPGTARACIQRLKTRRRSNLRSALREGGDACEWTRPSRRGGHHDCVRIMDRGRPTRGGAVRARHRSRRGAVSRSSGSRCLGAPALPTRPEIRGGCARGTFGDNVGASFGGVLDFGVRLGDTPFSVGAALEYLRYGTETRHLAPFNALPEMVA